MWSSLSALNSRRDTGLPPHSGTAVLGAQGDKALRTRRLRAMTPDLPFWEWFKPSNWAAIAQADTALAPPPSAPPALQRPLAEFGHELQAALEQAYFGPPLDHLAAGELPVAFEAEHRTLPDMGSLLQIVSGQTVLGEVQVHMLPQLNSDVAPQLDYSRAAPHDAGSKNDSDAFSAASLRTASMQGRFEDREAELHFSVSGRVQVQALSAQIAPCVCARSGHAGMWQATAASHCCDWLAGVLLSELSCAAASTSQGPRR